MADVYRLQNDIQLISRMIDIICEVNASLSKL
jgi:hypothetical protein